jgi:hypothetical protein
MAGLLDFDAMDPAQYQVSDDERKRIIFQNLMFQLAPALAGSRKGELLQGAAFGLTNGAMAAQQGLAGAQQGKYDKLKMASGLMDYQTKKGAYDDEQRARQVEDGFQMPPSVADMSPTPANAAALSAAPKAGTYERLMAKAQAYEDAKLPKKAAEYRAEAQKYRPKYSTTPHNVKGPDGKVQLAQFSEYDAPKILEGMSPAEKLHFGSTGGMTNVGFDQYTGAPVSQGLPSTLSASDKQSGDQWSADYKLRQNADSRAAKSAAQGPQPTFHEGQFVYPPNAKGGARAEAIPGYTAKPPEHTRRELDSIDAQLGIIAGAKDAAKRTPSAFSMSRGAATMGGAMTESLAGRLDSSDERNARSYVFNIVSAAINERAGAAQSVQELARLRSFLPGEMDNAKQVEDKLTAFETFLHDKRKAYAGAGGKAKTVNFADLPQ